MQKTFFVIHRFYRDEWEKKIVSVMVGSTGNFILQIQSGIFCEKVKLKLCESRDFALKEIENEIAIKESLHQNPGHLKFVKQSFDKIKSISRSKEGRFQTMTPFSFNMQGTLIEVFRFCHMIKITIICQMHVSRASAAICV